MRTYLRFTLSIIAWVVAVHGVTHAQQTARDAGNPASVGTASIVGTMVIDEPNAPPLRRAVVSVSIRSTTAVAQRQTTTDDQGRFVLANLPAGTYSAPRVMKGGFVAATYGEKRPNGIGTPITLAEGQRVSIAMKVLRGAVLTGMVHDNGRPIVTNVTAAPVTSMNGVPAAAGGRSYPATTDDRGIYRIYGLPPGSYVIGATPRLTGPGELRPITDAEIQWAQRQLQPGYAVAPGAAPSNVPPPPAQPIAYTTVFYPGTTTVTEAAILTVTAGQERSGIDFGLTYVPTAKIEGVILNPDGQPATGAQMNLVPMMEASSALIGDSLFLIDSVLLAARPTVTAGRFSMANVKPGRYTLAARAPASAGPGPGGGRGGPPPALTLWATAELSVDGVDQSDIELRLQPGMDLAGRVAFEAGALPPPTDFSRMTVRLNAAPTAGVSVSVNLPGGQIEADGTFEMKGIAPGKYHLSSFVPATSPGAGASWTLKSAKVGDVDAVDYPFEVKPGQQISNVVLTFTDKTSELSGTLLDAKGTPTSALSIILFSTDRAMWSQRSRRLRFPARPGTDGKFRFAGLVPGEYYLAALSDFEQADIYKPEFLEQVAAAAMKITIAEGEKKVQDLKIAGG